MRAYMDNVILQLQSVPTVTDGGIHIPDQARDNSSFKRTRLGTVLASGPGYHGKESRQCPGGVFVPNEAKGGDQVVVLYKAGTDYSWDLSAPRQNKENEFAALAGEDGEYRIIRHDEILAFMRDGKPVPTYDNLIVKHKELTATTPGGLHIPQNAQKRPLEGVVVALGPGKILGDGKRKPWDVEIGETVVFNKYCGTEVIVDGVEHLMIREENILGILE